MSANFDTLWGTIDKAVSNKEKEQAFLAALEAVTDWRHIRILCAFASFIRICPEVDNALLAKVIEIDKKDFGQRRDSMLRNAEFLSGITIRLDPQTKTFQWASAEKEKLTGISSRLPTQSRVRA